MRILHDARARLVAHYRNLSIACGSFSRTQLVIILALVTLLLAGAVVGFLRTGPGSEIEIACDSVLEPESDAPAAKRTVAVHVAGGVNSPGLYELSVGARVADAIDAAGGAIAGATFDNINLAAKLSDGDKVMVPFPGGPATPAGDPSGETGTGLVNINLATSDELQKLPGIGPSTADKIIEHRNRNGSFSSVDELDEVPGIGPAKLRNIRDLVTI